MIKAYLKEKIVKIQPVKGDYLEPGDPIETDVSARVNWKNKLVRNVEGEEIMSNVNIDIENDPDLYFDCQYRIDGVTFSVISIDRQQDFSTRYLKVYLG